MLWETPLHLCLRTAKWPILPMLTACFPICLKPTPCLRIKVLTRMRWLSKLNSRGLLPSFRHAPIVIIQDPMTNTVTKRETSLRDSSIDSNNFGVSPSSMKNSRVTFRAMISVASIYIWLLSLLTSESVLKPYFFVAYK
jgi:hypothetical protein